MSDSDTETDKTGETDMQELTNDLQGDGEYLTWLKGAWRVFGERMQGRLEPERAYIQWKAQAGVCAVTGLPMLAPVYTNGARKIPKTMYTACLTRRDMGQPMAARGNHVYVCNFVALMWNALSGSCKGVSTLDMFMRLCNHVGNN